MHTLRYWSILAAILTLVACGTPTSSTNSTTQATQATPSGAETSSTDGASTDSTTNSATQGTPKHYDAPPPMTIDENKSYTAVIETTKGTMRAELFAKEDPKTVNNFVFLARDNFYNNVKFHRIIKGFMVQTGDPLGNGTGGPGYTFEDEPVTRDYQRGTLAMANSGPNTNGSQFFIVHEDTQLPKSYTIFGKLTDGLDVLDAIASVPVANNPATNEPSVPQEEVMIKSITIEEK